MLRWLVLVVFLSGCGAPAVDGGADPVPAPEPDPGSVQAGAGSFQLGLPALGPLQGGAVLGIVVPANLTHLTVQVTITVGASVGLRAAGVPGCDHQYPDPQAMGGPLVYECDTHAGAHQLEFSHSGGRLHFDAVVTASRPAA